MSHKQKVHVTHAIPRKINFMNYHACSNSLSHKLSCSFAQLNTRIDARKTVPPPRSLLLVNVDEYLTVTDIIKKL